MAENADNRLLKGKNNTSNTLCLENRTRVYRTAPHRAHVRRCTTMRFTINLGNAPYPGLQSSALPPLLRCTGAPDLLHQRSLCKAGSSPTLADHEHPSAHPSTTTTTDAHPAPVLICCLHLHTAVMLTRDAFYTPRLIVTGWSSVGQNTQTPISKKHDTHEKKSRPLMR